MAASDRKFPLAEMGSIRLEIYRARGEIRVECIGHSDDIDIDKEDVPWMIFTFVFRCVVKKTGGSKEKGKESSTSSRECEPLFSPDRRHRITLERYATCEEKERSTSQDQVPGT